MAANALFDNSGDILGGDIFGSNDAYQSKVSGVPSIEGISTRNAEYYGCRIGNNINPTQKAINIGQSISSGLNSFWNWLIK